MLSYLALLKYFDEEPQQISMKRSPDLDLDLDFLFPTNYRTT